LPTARSIISTIAAWIANEGEAAAYHCEYARFARAKERGAQVQPESRGEHDAAIGSEQRFDQFFHYWVDIVNNYVNTTFWLK
jgi:hypothetical protein